MTHRLLLLLILIALTGEVRGADDYGPPSEALRRLSFEYRQAVAEHHADSSDARDLAVAAMLATREPGIDMARGLQAPGESESHWLDARALAWRALKRGPDDPVVLWSVLTGDATRRDPALVRTAVSLLREADPDNAATWLLQLQVDDATLTDAEQLELLERAAASGHYGTGYSDLARLLVAAFRAVEPPARLHDELTIEGGEPFPVEAMPVAFGFGLMMAALPPITLALESCGGSSETSTVPEERRDACLRLGQLMAQEGDTMIDELMGLRVWERSATTDEEREAARQQRRVAEWRSSAHAELMQAARQLGESDPEWKFVQSIWMRPDTTEIAAQRQLLTEAGVALQPPEGFLSRQQQASGD